MVWRAPSRQLNPDKPHYNNSFNRAHDGTGGAPGSGSGYVKQPWKPRNEDGGAAGAGTGGYQPRSAWNKPGERTESGAPRGRSDSQENTAAAPRSAGGWQRGLTAAATASAGAAASAPAPVSPHAGGASGMSSATAALQAAVGINKTAAKGAVAPPIPVAAAPVVNAWARKAPVI